MTRIRHVKGTENDFAEWVDMLSEAQRTCFGELESSALELYLGFARTSGWVLRGMYFATGPAFGDNSSWHLIFEGDETNCDLYPLSAFRPRPARTPPCN